VFYGWKIVGVCFVTLFVSVGFGFYSFGAFFKVLAEEFGVSRAMIGLGLSLFTLTNGLIAPYLGRSIDRGSIRTLMTVGVVLLALGQLTISRVTSIWQFHLVLATLTAVGAALIGGLTTSTLVANWFERQRGTALGIATMGISLSGVVMAPVATLLIARYGWRTTFVLYAIGTLCTVLPVVRALVINRPEDIGLGPDGDPLDAPHSPQPTGASRKVAGELPATGGVYSPVPSPFRSKDAFSDRNFWAIAAVIALNFCANGAILTHLIPHASDLGFSPAQAAAVLSLGAGLGVGGKVLFGWLADHVDIRMAMWLSSSMQGVAVIALLYTRSYPAVLIAGGLFGLGMGGLVPLWGTLIGAAFGRRAFGQVMGLMSPFLLPLQVGGVPFAGWIFDRTGSYSPAFVTFIVLYGLSIVLLVFLRLPPRGSTVTQVIKTGAHRR
jgi:MFS family permease